MIMTDPNDLIVTLFQKPESESGLNLNKRSNCGSGLGENTCGPTLLLGGHVLIGPDHLHTNSIRPSSSLGSDRLGFGLLFYVLQLVEYAARRKVLVRRRLLLVNP